MLQKRVLTSNYTMPDEEHQFASGTLALGVPGQIYDASPSRIHTEKLASDADVGSYVDGKGVLVNVRELALVGGVNPTTDTHEALYPSETVSGGDAASFMTFGHVVVKKSAYDVIKTKMNVEVLAGNAESEDEDELLVVALNGFGGSGGDDPGHVTDDREEIPDDEYSGDLTLTSISLPNCTSIGAGAFAGCTNLETVDFTEPSAALSRTLKLTAVSSVPTLGEGAFDGCTSLDEIKVPDALYWSFRNSASWSRVGGTFEPQSGEIPEYDPSSKFVVTIPSGGGTVHIGTDDGWGDGVFVPPFELLSGHSRVTIDFGDGTSETYDAGDAESPIVHDYADQGTYTVSISDDVKCFYAGENESITEVLQWGDNVTAACIWSEDGRDYFGTYQSCESLTLIPAWNDAITNAEYCYSECHGLTGTIPAWNDVITNAEYCYQSCTSLTGVWDGATDATLMPNHITEHSGCVSYATHLRPYFTPAWGGTK